MTAAATPDRPCAGQASLGKGAKPCVGVLFVHGAGEHGVGATLLEFGEPLVAWLDGWLSRGNQSDTAAGDRARTGATQILVREADDHAPAHATVSICAPDKTQHVWLFAEARWDEAFTPPAFKQVLQWAIGVVPWTVLTQFIGPLVDEAHKLQPSFFSILKFLWDVLVALVLALVASVVLLFVAIVAIVLSIVPLEPVREIVGKLQRFASTAVGDLYLVLMSPIQRAALASAVQRDIDWLRDQTCSKIAVIAHSQGGYVAHQALSDPWSRPVDAFITHGSGLIRLTESDRARRRGFLPIALIGVLGALIAIRFGPSGILGTLELIPKAQASAFAFLVGSVMALGIPIALIRYLRTRQPVDDLPTPIPWTDYLTREDPVLNGPPGGRLPERVTKTWIRNRASVIADHGSYWLNTDQFVSRVAIDVGGLDPGLALRSHGPIADDASAQAFLDRSWARRDRRVEVLKTVRAPLAIATAALIALRREELAGLGNRVAGLFDWVPDVVQTWLPSVIASALPFAAANIAIVGAIVVAVLSAIGYSAAIRRWEAWSRADTVSQFRGELPDAHSSGGMGFFGWTTIHFAVLGATALVGFNAIAAEIGYVWAARDAIVQAWARIYVWSLVVAAALIAINWIRTKVRPSRAYLLWIGGATSLALLIELAIAVARPGALVAFITIPLGIVTELVALGLTRVLMPPLTSALHRGARWLQIRLAKPPDPGPFATRLDGLGVVGIVLMWIAAALVIQRPFVAIGTGVLVAIVALVACGFAATNDRVREFRPWMKLLNVERVTPPYLRVVAWTGVALSAGLLVVGVVRATQAAIAVVS